MRKRILVVDDEPDLRETMGMLFSKDYEVLAAADGPEALRILNDQKPDLMLLDIVMPGMNGLEVLKAARSRSPQLAVLMITGEMGIALAERALTLGARAYITKPFDLDTLFAEVKRILDPAPAKSEDSGKPWRIAGA